MPLGKDISFGKFRLDAVNECLWRNTARISLRPKAFAVLKLLIERSGQLVTKQHLLDTVWPGTFVSDAVLKDSIRQLREALNDDAESPRYIETAHRRGYRFIASPSTSATTEQRQTGGRSNNVPSSEDEIASLCSAPSCRVLGRESEFEKMRAWMDRAFAGERQMVFVTGEAGIGKTTLVEALLRQGAEKGGVTIARGQCLEHYGASEAYMPVLDALSRLGRSPSGKRIIEFLQEHAPAWLAQIPSLLPASERVGPQGQTSGVTRERMLREIAEAIEAITAEVPLIFLLEDLHWSDYSTLDLISYLARRRDPARLMLLGTYRPVEVILGDHPLKGVKRELQAHGLCRELPLEYLTEESIKDYLSARFPGHRFSRRLSKMVHERTEGNPLFMVNVLEYLVDEKIIVQEKGDWKLQVELSRLELGVPENLRQLIERQIERLTPDERTVLEGASVVGMECSSVAIAAGLDKPTEWVEQHCEELARRHQFLSPAWLVELPDGTITPRHKFNHILYLEVPYKLVPPMRRAQIHHRIAERGVAIYGDQVCIIAAELAMHFEQSRDWPLALQYLSQAAENASRRSAHHEAADLATRGLAVIKLLPDSPQSAQQEISLRMTLGVSLMAMKGFAAPEVEEVYARARELFWLQGPSPQLFHMLWSLGLYYIFRGEIPSALELANQLLELASGLQDGPLIMEAHRAIGVTLVDLGRSSDALLHLNEAIKLYATHRNHRYAAFIGHDCKVVSECFAARALWALGYPDRAEERMAAALAHARDLGHPQTSVVAAHFLAQLHQLRGEVTLAHERAKEVVELADEYGLDLWLAFGNIDLGWAEAELGKAETGVDRMQSGLAAYETTGAKLWRPHFLGLLATALARVQKLEEALGVAAEATALAESSQEMYSLPELYRIRAQLLIMRAAAHYVDRSDRFPKSSTKKQAKQTNHAISSELVEANQYLAPALALAQRQQTKSWELRLLVTQNLLDAVQGLQEAHHSQLRDTYAWFTEGHGTMDLRHARIILESTSTDTKLVKA